MKNSSAITSFQVGTGGKFEETLVAKTDQKADTRVIQYEAKSLSGAQAARVKIDIPAANYHEQYDVKLVYDTKGIALGEGSGISTVIGDDESIGFIKNPNDHDSPTNQLENAVPEETGAEQMTFTPSDDQTKSESGQLNPKTGDTSLLWVYILFIRRFVIGTRQKISNTDKIDCLFYVRCAIYAGASTLFFEKEASIFEASNIMYLDRCLQCVHDLIGLLTVS
ncbi:hypothetical protein BsIDN1_68280 [Bacillus safensis]|uniref:NEAT domain-containing protein n=1 Tax=Bacillus safensis TaxID=561879 RepID=A0A5S9MIF1_BACIA|nr:hypothetical protein BsIDN1_68280 [Bacillus safensis]